jgi:hypothetical protein
VYGSTFPAQKNVTAKKAETKEAAPAQAKNTGGRQRIGLPALPERGYRGGYFIRKSLSDTTIFWQYVF